MRAICSNWLDSSQLIDNQWRGAMVKYCTEQQTQESRCWWKVIGHDVLVCDEKNLQWILNQLQVVKVSVCVYQTTTVNSLQKKKAVYFKSSII